MKPEEVVETLYRICLDRSAEPEGLAQWTALIRSTGDPTLVLKGILESSEYNARRSRSEIQTQDFGPYLASVDRRVRIVDVGAQSLGADTHPYASLLKLVDAEVIGFDPLVERLRERAETESASGLTLLPYALGDGGKHTFHVNNEDATSSLFALDEQHNARFNHLSTLYTVRTEQIITRRMDDVLPDGPVDFLKLDVQGAELMVLQAAERTLSQTAVIHCEVEFSPIYRGQPLFPAVYDYLMAQSFVLIDLLIPGRYHYLTPSGRSAQDRLLWADAVFFRESNEPAILRSQALISAAVYHKPTLAEHLLHIAGGGIRERDQAPRKET